MTLPDAAPPSPARITLSSIPPRFDALGPTLASLCDQAQAAPVELWIPLTYRRFPDWDGQLPAVPPGVTIRRCAQDWGPATKIVPAVLECLERGETGTDLLFCDDDSLYAPDFLNRFRALRRDRPAEALAAVGRQLPGTKGVTRRADRLPRMRRLGRRVTQPALTGEARWQAPVALIAESGYADLLGGWGGVMVQPGFFARALAEGPGECWPVDDVWLSAMLELGGTAIWVEASILPPRRRRVGAREALTLTEIDGQGREALDARCVAVNQSLHGLWPFDSA